MLILANLEQRSTIARKSRQRRARPLTWLPCSPSEPNPRPKEPLPTQVHQGGREFTRKNDGSTDYFVNLDVRRMEKVGGSAGDDLGPPPRGEEPPLAEPTPNDFKDDDFKDDDIPF